MRLNLRHGLLSVWSVDRMLSGEACEKSGEAEWGHGPHGEPGSPTVAHEQFSHLLGNELGTHLLIPVRMPGDITS